MSKRRSWPLVLVLLGACAPKTTGEGEQPEQPEQPEPSTQQDWVDSEAVAGVEDPELRALLQDHWDTTMARNPTWATQLGDRRFDEQLPDIGPEARELDLELNRAWLQRARALLETDRLGADDQITLELFIGQLEARLDDVVCKSWSWEISPRMNPLVFANRLHDTHPVDDPEHGRTLVARYSKFPAYVDQAIANLQVGLESGRVANAESLERTVKMFDQQLEEPLQDWPLMGPAQVDHDWPEAEVEAYRADLHQAAKDIKVAMARYRDLLRDELLPQGRKGDQVGLFGLPDGEACYQARVHRFTTLEPTPKDLHQTGLDELQAIHAEMKELGSRLFDTDDLAKIFERLRSDPDLYFDTEVEVEETARQALEASREAMVDYFGILPQADCVVRPIPSYEAPYTTIAYYRRPAPDGSRPGEYFVNTYAPETRPRHEAEALAYHEAIPGHHLQIAIAQELDQVPAFRRYGGMTAFVEGWALYAERLADEMDLYSGDLDRMGMLSYDAWRASRLVVDTGIHAKGWTRASSERFFEENTPLALNNIENEVDRYITWPGQALAYKTGQLTIAELRAQSEQALGDDFDIRDFHDVVLGAGAVSLPVLERRVQEWVTEVED